MRNTFNISILRSIRGSLGRFLAIAGIVALGCGFYAGLRMTAPDMDLAADEYYDQTDLMDIRVVSTLGLTDDDIEAIRAVDGVAQAAGEYETDVMITLGEEQYSARVHSLPAGLPLDAPREEQDAALAGTLNHLELTEGSWPQAPDECVVSADRVMAEPVQVGDRIRVDECVQDLDDTLTTREFTVSGLAHSPYYASTTAMGSTTLGSGTIEQFMYVPAGAFAADLPYTEAFIGVAGAKDLESGSAGYQDRVDEVVKGLEGIAPEREQARLAGIKAEAQEELDEQRADYERERADAEAKLADAKADLDSAAATIADSEQKLASGQREYDDGVSQLAAQKASAEKRLADAQAQLDDQAAQLASQRASLEEQRPQLAAAVAQLEQAAAADPDNQQIQQQLAQAKAGLAQVDAGLQQIAAGEAQIAAGREQLAAQRADADAQMAAAQRKLDAAAAELDRGRAQLAQGKRDYASGKAEYDDQNAQAQREFADAEQKLADAQADIDALDPPEWLIMDRTKVPGAVSFESDADRVDSIAQFFPFIFFLVAALVALTTMTRMVEEERILIGTFKALGYSRARITSKYLIYAATASIAGAAIGIVALSLLLPPIIMEAYAIIYSVPHGLIMPIDPAIAFGSAALGVGVTLLATWAAVAATLREAPAQLMLPPAPKAGKRILLERITPVWRRLSFSWKVTFRNIFRYKKRLFMTVIGIAGCTGLLLTGLALQDAVNDIIDKQFGRTVLYNVEVTGDDDLDDASKDQLAALTEQRAFAQAESMKASGPDRSDVSVSVIAPQDSEAFQELWVMRTREGHDPVPLGEDSVVISEKLGTLLGLGVGDELTLAEQDTMGNATNTTYSLRITGIMENYIANYVFLGQGVYQGVFGDAPEARTMFAKVGDAPEDHQAFREAANQVSGVKTVAFNNETIDSYRSMLRSVNMIVVVLVVAAAALAFIVLYNLTNINITERHREIATLKVLGFTPREVDLYIYRETIILTVLGALLGLAFGVFLAGFVITTAEVDYVMFGRDIHPTSYVVAFLVTLVFAMLVMLLMRRKLANVNMVESLKSNE